MRREQLKQLLDMLKKGLIDLYGVRLKGVYLFGSYARGTQEPESDLDVLIVLEGFKDYVAEIDRSSELVASLSLQHDLLISVVFVKEPDWKSGQNPFIRNVRQEAKAA